MIEATDLVLLPSDLSWLMRPEPLLQAPCDRAGFLGFWNGWSQLPGVTSSGGALGGRQAFDEPYVLVLWDL